MRIWPAALLIPVLAATAFADPLTDKTASDIKARYAAEVACGPDSRDLNRQWCRATEIGSQPFVLPKTAVTWLGITMELKDGAKVVPAALDTTSLSALHLGPGGVRLTYLKPSNADEKKGLDQVVMQLGFALKGRADTLEVPADLAGYLDGERQKPMHPVIAGKNSADYAATLPSRIYHVSNGYVVIETAAGGSFVSIFSETPMKTRN